MNVINFINAFFSDSAHWQGYDGIPTRLWEHVQYSVEALVLAAVIGLPIGLITGHYGRGGNVLDPRPRVRHAARDDPADRPRRPADPGHHL